MDISLVIPLLDEAESLAELEGWIRRVMQENDFTYEILFIDDGSKDNSWAIINELKQQNPHIVGIKFRRNYGKSAGLSVGFEEAKGEVVITMDADLQDSPDEIPGLYKMIKEQNLDLVSGWKKKRFDPITKTLPSKFYNGFTRMVSGIKLHDFNCGLKAYRNEVVKNIEVYGEMHRYIPLIAKWQGFDQIGEKVVQHAPRKYGKSKFGVERVIKGALDVLSILFVGRFGKSPMHFFGSLGSLFFAIGFIILLILSYNKLVNQEYGIADRPLFYFGILTIIIGTQLFVTGFLAELVARGNPDRNNYQVVEIVRDE